MSKEDNSSLTEDEASECDSDSSVTNKRPGASNSNSELLGEESPSRMRTRNKQAKDQTNSKRPKRGTTDAADSTIENQNNKTPTKNDKRKTGNKTEPASHKAKKRPNIDLDAENETSDDKDKRKRCDVSKNAFKILLEDTVSVYVKVKNIKELKRQLYKFWD